MIKRTIGRLLLALLVITGLAGTINDNSLSKAERKYATGLMKETYKDLLRATDNLTEIQYNYKSAPEKWSVKECVYHIAASEKGLWMMLENAMKTPASPEKRSEIKVTDEELVAMIKDRSKKAQAPEFIQPKNAGYNSMNEALADFKLNRVNHIKYMKTSTEDMRNRVIQLPFGLWVDCYQLYLVIGAHSNRHTQQINEVKATQGFPVK